MSDARLRHLPMILETPDYECDAMLQDMVTMRRLYETVNVLASNSGNAFLRLQNLQVFRERYRTAKRMTSRVPYCIPTRTCARA